MLWSTVSRLSIVNEAEVDVFLEFPCILYDPINVGNLIFGSSAFSKPTFYIWKFLIHILLKPSLKDFERNNLASMWKWVQLGGSLNILWHCPSLGLEWKLTFSQSCGHCWVFQIYWLIECSTLTASSFRILNCSDEILSLPLALLLRLIVMELIAQNAKIHIF